MNILQGIAVGEFISDELVLMPRSVIPHNHDPFARVQSDEGLDRFKDGGSILPIQAQGHAFTRVLIQEPNK